MELVLKSKNRFITRTNNFILLYRIPSDLYIIIMTRKEDNNNMSPR